MKQEPYPDIAVVIIGINVERYICECITSVLEAEYPAEKLHAVFVDGGSNDRSVELAKGFDGVRVIELKDPSPTPGKGRNAGFRAVQAPLIQFMDADTTLHPAWFEKALPYFKDKVAAVCGYRKERYPEKNFYHTIGNIEWRYEEGPCRYFGGEALIQRDVLEQCGGYDEDLVAGEDPDLSYRIRQKGWIIYRIKEEMTTHDLNMTKFRQYLKRAFRTGHAYAEIGLRYARNKEKMWVRELLRITAGVCVPWLILILGMLFGNLSLGLILAFVTAFRPLWKTFRFKREFNLTTPAALFYALHLSFVVYPQFAGVLRYIYTLIAGSPLRNKGYIPEGNV